MKRVLVRYKVLADRAGENERRILQVFEQLAREQPAGLRYASFKLDDGVSFVHLAETAEGGAALADLAAFKAFTAGIQERCEEAPVVTTLNEVGTYGLFGSERTSRGMAEGLFAAGAAVHVVGGLTALG